MKGTVLIAAASQRLLVSVEQIKVRGGEALTALQYVVWKNH